MTAAIIDAGDDLPLTVPRLLRERAAAHPDDALLVCDDDRLTYAEADARSAVLAKALLAAGVSARTRVAILRPNGPDFVVAWLAAARIGAVSVPLSTFSTASELVGLLHGSDVAFLLAASTYRSHDYPATLQSGIVDLDLVAPAPLLAETVPSLRRIAFDVDGSTRVMHSDWTLPGLLAGSSSIDDEVLSAAADAVTPADPMVIVHTSGSTSEPKGVIHTHGALIRHLDNLNQLRRYEPGEILFSNSPFFWIGGFAYALLGTLVAGATLVCSNAPEAAGVLDVLERQRPTMVNGFAASVADLPRDPSFGSRDLSSIRRGNLYPIMPDAVRPRDPARHHAMLGMTEAGSVCLASEDESEQPEHRRGSFGTPVPGFEAEVRREEDREVCVAGEPGELWFRGPFLMEGYDGRERSDVFDGNEWYCTGDLVTVDSDGFFYFRGRSSDMIKTAGANVSPREVEAAVLETSGLASHVLGLDDTTRGQIVAALVRSDGPVDVDDLRAQLRQRLSAYKVPRTIVVVPDEKVPMMSSGKIDLRALEELLVALDVGTIPELLALRHRADGDRQAIVTNDRAITYTGLDEASASTAARFVADGVVKGDRVGLLAPNGIDWAVAASAATRIGAVLVPLSTLLRPPELIAQLATASVTHLVLEEEFRGRRYLEEVELAHPSLLAASDPACGTRSAAAPSLRRVWTLEQLLAGSPAPIVSDSLVRAMEARVRPADDFVVLFTSGSTGPPKGVIHTHGSALRATAAGLEARCVERGERLYIPMPLFWTGGLGTGLLSAWIVGATLLTEAEPEPTSTLTFLERERVTLFRGWPDQAAKLAAHPAFARTDLSSLGDGSLPAVLSSDRRPAPGARPNVFGMTESFGPYCGDRLDVDMPREKFGSCGRPFADVEVRIADEESGAEMPAGEQGEIWIRGRNLLRGICGRNRSSVFTADGYYRTGDLGRLDADGYVWYAGRLDDMFKVKGASVYPSEVEAALRSVHAIRQAHVTDVVGDDGLLEVGALVVTDAPVEDVITAVKDRLSAFKVPSRWHVTSDAGEVPMLATGKIDKAALRALLRSKEDA